MTDDPDATGPDLEAVSTADLINEYRRRLIPHPDALERSRETWWKIFEAVEGARKAASDAKKRGQPARATLNLDILADLDDDLFMALINQRPPFALWPGPNTHRSAHLYSGSPLEGWPESRPRPKTPEQWAVAYIDAVHCELVEDRAPVKRVVEKFGVHDRTVSNWKLAHPEVRDWVELQSVDSQMVRDGRAPELAEKVEAFEAMMTEKLEEAAALFRRR